MNSKSVYLVTALECLDRIESYVTGYSLETFREDRKTQDAVIRNLEVIGQALKDYGIDSLIEKVPDTPWRQIAGMRNVDAPVQSRL